MNPWAAAQPHFVGQTIAAADSHNKTYSTKINVWYLHLYTIVIVILTTDRVPNNHPGHQISGFGGAMAL